MRILKLLHDTLPHARGGVEVYARDLALALAARGHEVTVLAAMPPGPGGEYAVRRERLDGLPLVTVGHRTGRAGGLLGTALRPSGLYRSRRVEAVVEHLLPELAPQVAHVHHLFNLSGGLVETLARSGVPVVVTLHDYWYLCPTSHLLNERGPHEPEDCGAPCLKHLLVRYPARGLRGAVRRGLARLMGRRPARFDRFVRARRAELVRQLAMARRLVAPSRFLLERYRRSGLADALLVHSDYGTRHRGSPRARGPRRPVRFGYLGRMIREKGVHVLLEAFTRLGAGATLAIHGDGEPDYERALRALVKDSRVVFGGAYEPDRVGALLSEIDVLMVPSVWPENSPLVIHEAFAAGVPVVASSAGGIPELVRPEVGGLLAPMGDVEALAGAMGRILDEPGLLEALSGSVPPVKSIEEDAGEMSALYAEALG